MAERARYRCEYCRAPEAAFNFGFEVEHIWPVSRGGSDDTANLAFACRGCNVFKGSAVGAADPETGEIVRLFDPRHDLWHEHFRVRHDALEIEGTTPIGR